VDGFNLEEELDIDNVGTATALFLKDLNQQNIQYDNAYIVIFNRAKGWDAASVERFNARSGDYTTEGVFVDKNDSAIEEPYYLRKSGKIWFMVINGKVYDFYERKDDPSKVYSPKPLRDYLLKTFLPEKITNYIQGPDGGKVGKNFLITKLLVSDLEIIKPQIHYYEEDYYTILDYEHGVNKGSYKSADFLLHAGLDFSDFKTYVEKEIDSKKEEKRLTDLVAASETRAPELTDLLKNLNLSSDNFPFFEVEKN
jgi:hypothetical protein